MAGQSNGRVFIIKFNRFMSSGLNRGGCRIGCGAALPREPKNNGMTIAIWLKGIGICSTPFSCLWPFTETWTGRVQLHWHTGKGCSCPTDPPTPLGFTFVWPASRPTYSAAGGGCPLLLSVSIECIARRTNMPYSTHG